MSARDGTLSIWRAASGLFCGVCAVSFVVVVAADAVSGGLLLRQSVEKRSVKAEFKAPFYVAIH
jgi:hypothetical protein